MQCSPLRAFLGWFTLYFTLCIFVCSHSDLILLPYFSEDPVQLLYLLVNFLFLIILISVWLLFIILIVEMYSRYFDSVKKLLYVSLPSQVNKHYTNTRLAYFSVSIGFRRPISTMDVSWNIRNQFIRLGLRRARQSL